MIGERLKELRTKQKLTIAQAAEALGMNANTYAKYERNERDVSTDGLCQIAGFYNVTVDYLLGREPAPDPFGELGLSAEDEQEVLNKYMSLPENVRAIMLDVLRKLGGAADENSELRETTDAGTLHDKLLDTEAEEDAG